MQTKIYFPIICYNHTVLVHYLFSVMKLSNDAIMKGIPIVFDCIYFDSLVARARNAAAAGFLNHPTATHMLFVDTDISFSSSDVFKMLDKNEEVVCGLYPKKYISVEKLNAISKTLNHLPSNYDILCTDFAAEIKNSSTETIDYAATGFMLIKKEVFRKIIDKYPEIKYKNDIKSYNHYGDNFYNFFPCEVNKETKKYESEDYGFSRLWRECGGKIYVEKSCELTHYGWKGYSGSILAQSEFFK